MNPVNINQILAKPSVRTPSSHCVLLVALLSNTFFWTCWTWISQFIFGPPYSLDFYALDSWALLSSNSVLISALLFLPCLICNLISRPSVFPLSLSDCRLYYCLVLFREILFYVETGLFCTPLFWLSLLHPSPQSNPICGNSHLYYSSSSQPLCSPQFCPAN